MQIVQYWKLMRTSNGFLALIAVVAGAVVSGAGAENYLSIAYLAVSVFILSGAGIAINDYYDYEIDKINAPDRPLPSGKISKKSALAFTIIMFIIGISLAYFVNIYAFALAVINTILEFLYSWKLKPIALIGNIVDSWFAASSFLYGALITGNMHIVWLLIAMSLFANLGREIYGDVEDVVGDKKMGAKTLPIIAGEGAAVLAGRLAIIIAILMSILPYYLGYFGLRYLAIVAVADALFVISMTQDAHKNQKTTKIAMFVGLMAFLAG